MDAMDGLQWVIKMACLTNISSELWAVRQELWAVSSMSRHSGHCLLAGDQWWSVVMSGKRSQLSLDYTVEY